MRTTSRFVLASTLLVAAWSAAPTASAQSSDDEQAHAHFAVAASYYEQANYDAALREFQEAYRLSQRPALFYNLSLCYVGLGDLEHAVDYLTRYLHDVSDIANRASLETRLENLRQRLEQQRAQASSSSSTTTTTTETGTESGTTTTTSTGTETSTTTTTTTASGETASASGGGDSLNVGAIAGFSVAAVGLVGGAIFSGLAAAEDSRLAGTPCGMARTCGDSELSTLRTNALVADIMWGVSLAGAGVGLILLLVNPGGSSGGEHARVHVDVGLASLSVGGSF